MNECKKVPVSIESKFWAALRRKRLGGKYQQAVLSDESGKVNTKLRQQTSPPVQLAFFDFFYSLNSFFYQPPFGSILWLR